MTGFEVIVKNFIFFLTFGNISLQNVFGRIQKSTPLRGRGYDVKYVQGRGCAYDIQINESHSPLLFLILHGEGAEGGRGYYLLCVKILIYERLLIFFITPSP